MARFSIRGLLIAVTFLAVACAALQYAGPVWWMILASAALLISMAAAVVAAAGGREQRAKAAAFLLCFLIYGVALAVPPDDELGATDINSPPGGPATAVDALPTTWITKQLMAFSPMYVSGRQDIERGRTDRGVEKIRYMYVYASRIGHLLWAMFFGVLGSVFAGVVYRRSHQASDD